MGCLLLACQRSSERWHLRCRLTGTHQTLGTAHGWPFCSNRGGLCLLCDCGVLDDRGTINLASVECRVSKKHMSAWVTIEVTSGLLHEYISL